MNIKINLKLVRKILFFELSMVCLLGAVAMTSVKEEPGVAGNETEEAPSYPRVSVVESHLENVTAKINARGQVNAEFQTTIVAEVTARVHSVSDSLASGRVVEKGELLALLDDTDYQKEFAVALNDLAAAEVTLLQEERQGRQARLEWKRANLSGEPDSPLLLREPQIKAAQASVSSAKASVVWAKKQIENTQIRAPFRGVIVERQISPGSYLQAGQAVATLYGSDRMEVRLSLSPLQWGLLPSEEQMEAETWKVMVSNGTGENWEGTVGRLEYYADPATRQRGLIVSVDNTQSERSFLLPGTFVEVALPGRHLNEVLALPQSSMTTQGYIWYVSEDDTLSRYHTVPLYREGDYIFVKPPGEESSLRVLQMPLSSYLPGMKVTVDAQIEGEGDQ